MSRAAIVSMKVDNVVAATVFAEGCSVSASPAGLIEELKATVAFSAEKAGDAEHLELKKLVRKMLRYGAYHPSGRGKPASEYLLSAAVKGDFPIINNLVDVINLVSLRCLIPISLVDVERAGTCDFNIRRGLEGESYVFNTSGQTLALRDLLLLSRMPGDNPCATPVKDSHATKVHNGSRKVLGVIYAPSALMERAAEAAALMANLFKEWGGAAHCELTLCNARAGA